MTDPTPSRTYECVPCEQTYLAGAHAGPGPFACEFCGASLTLRPEGAEPYQTVKNEPLTITAVGQMELL